MSAPEFTITRTFDARRETIWRAWTDPDLASRWWHPHDVTSPRTSVKIDLRVGGRYEYVMIDGSGGRWPVAGEYLEVRAPERLRFTWGSPDEPRGDGVPVITVDLDETAAGRTRMTFRLVGIANDSGTDESAYDGWTEAFEELDEVLVARP